MKVTDLKIGMILRCKAESYNHQPPRVYEDYLLSEWRLSMFGFEGYFDDSYKVMDEGIVYVYTGKRETIADEDEYIFAWNDYRFIADGKRIVMHEQNLAFFEEIKDD